MEVKIFTTPDALKPFIKYVSYIETEGQNTVQKTFTPIVDGCPGLLIQDLNFGTIERDGKTLPASFLFGQTTQAKELKVNGNFKALCVCFHPHTIGSLFKLNAETLTDTCLALESLSNGYNLTSQMEDAPTEHDKVAALNSYLLNKLALEQANPDSSVNYILNKITGSNGTYPLKKLKEEVHLSERSFERKFKQQVGISAQLFSRICRFQSSFQQLKNNDFKRLTDIAFQNTYADQSHFVRAFKEFTGLPPSQYQKRFHVVTENLSECYR